MKADTTLPVIPVGLSRLWLALKAPPPRRAELVDDTPWSDAYLSEAFAFRRELTLREMGYDSHELEEEGLDLDRAIGIGDSFRPLTDEGVRLLRRACEALMDKSDGSDWIISRRTRGATQFSAFIDGMMNSPAFLERLSRLVGVPLVPYPMVRARSQVNYFHSKEAVADAAEEIGMWHRDGTAFVVNLLLTDPSEFEGGEFLYFDRHAGAFDRDDIDEAHVRASELASMGDAGFIAGTRVYHAVRPVRRGTRISLVMSFHCPYTSHDVNEFWHLASDDGLVATLPAWRHLQRALRATPEAQYGRLGMEAPLTFDGVRRPA